MSRYCVVGGLLISLLLVTCCGCRDSSSPLVGKWKSGKIATEWGDGETIIVFSKEIMTVSFVPTSGDVVRTSASYEVRAGAIVSEAINSGLPMPYSIKGKVLLLVDAASQETRLIKD